MFPARVTRLRASAAAAAAILCSTVLISNLSAQTPARSGRAVLGTESEDYAAGTAVGPDGDIFVTGSLGYANPPLPLTAGAYQAANTEYGGAYLAKLGPNASLKILSVFAPNARGEAIALDAAGNIVIAGIASGVFPVTTGAFNSGVTTGPRAFVIKLSPDASQILFSAVLGRVIPQPDLSGGNVLNQMVGPSLRLALDSSGNALIAGTAGAGFLTTALAFDRGFAGASEAFVAKLSADGTSLLYSTFLGGSGADSAHGLAVDAADNAIVSGTSDSTDFPTTTLLNDGEDRSAYVARISPDGGVLDFSTRISGENGADGRDVALGPGGDIYLTGVTRSKDFPSTGRPFDTAWFVPRAEGFVMRLTADGTTILYSTSLLTGAPASSPSGLETGSHMPISLIVDVDGRAHVVGTSGAGANVYANVPMAFQAVVAADGESYTGGITGGNINGQSGFYDIATNASRDIARVLNTTVINDVFGVQPTYGKSPFYTWEGEWEGPGQMYPDGVVSWTIAARPPAGNTATGSAVTVSAANNAATVTFGTVTTAGSTTFTPVDAAALNLSLPGGFGLSGTAQAFEIQTTAVVSGIQVCLSGASLSDVDFATASILHGVGGAWQVEPTVRDTTARTLCATVTSLSPFAVGVRLDEIAPLVSIVSPTNRRYLVNETVTASYTCTDAQSGVVACTAPVPSGSTLDTSRAGSYSFSVASRDAAGNAGEASLSYTVGYNVEVLLPQTLTVKKNETVAIAIQLLGAGNTNVSSAGVAVTLLDVKRAGTAISVPIQDSDRLNPGNQFRFVANSYVYALGTKHFARGSYDVTFTAGADPVVHSVTFTVR
jgi:hypothetical protein